MSTWCAVQADDMSMTIRRNTEIASESEEESDAPCEDSDTSESEESDPQCEAMETEMSTNQWIKVPKSNVSNAPDERLTLNNRFRVRAGLKRTYAAHISSELDAWRMLINDTILNTVQQKTEQNGLKTTTEELLSFIGLQYARGLYGKHHSVTFLWSKIFGGELFRKTMSRGRFLDILKSLRFDDKEGRTSRKAVDPFTHIRDVFETFTANCREAYTPYHSLYVDSHLMSLKNSKQLLAVIPSKAEHYGIKFWMLVDNQTKYVYNVIPCLGATEKSGHTDESYATDVVCRLMEGLFDRGYNLTMPKFFTSIPLATELKRRGTTIVGALRSSRSGMSSRVRQEQLRMYGTVFYRNETDQQLLACYRSKGSSTINILSTMHQVPHVENTRKKKPSMLLFFNNNKNGVHAVDTMIRLYSCRATSRKWPVVVWTHILDIALINAWVCYREATGSDMSRKVFLFNLIRALCQPTISAKERTFEHPEDYPMIFSRMKKCSVTSCRNKNSVMCMRCDKAICGTCCAPSAPKIRFSVCIKCQNAQPTEKRNDD